jgi:tRNA (uracil-5-)-methyltransferase
VNAHARIPAELVSAYRNFAKFKRGATLLLRDSLPVDVPIEEQVKAGPVAEEQHICITDHHAVVRERVADKMFTFSANSFFQNNNGILRSLVESIRDILPSDKEDSFLVDTYCGSGLFAITLAEKFKEVAGVEISCEFTLARKSEKGTSAKFAALIS